MMQTRQMIDDMDDYFVQFHEFDHSAIRTTEG